MRTSNISKFFLVALFFAMFSGQAVARKHEQNDPLCSIKRVFVAGNSESATRTKKMVEKRTWLALAQSSENADGILAVEEKTGVEPVTHDLTGTKWIVSATLTPKGTKDPVWSGYGSSISDEAAVEKMLHQLSNAGSCK
jgi:hypothetical protein